MHSEIGPWSSIADITCALKEGRQTAQRIAELALERAEKVQGELNCFAQIDAPGLIDQARTIDARRQAGEALGPLVGVPVAIKDCTPVKGLGNRMGSYAYADFVADHDAEIVARFRQADAMILILGTLRARREVPLVVRRLPWPRAAWQSGRVLTWEGRSAFRRLALDLLASNRPQVACRWMTSRRLLMISSIMAC